jgi:hypothetical protein
MTTATSAEPLLVLAWLAVCCSLLALVVGLWLAEHDRPRADVVHHRLIDWQCTRCGRCKSLMPRDGCDVGPCPMIPVWEDLVNAAGPMPRDHRRKG